MKDRHPIDNLFKDQLYDQQQPVPEQVWQRVYARLQPDDKKAAFWTPYRWLGLAVIAVAGLVGYQLLYTPTTTQDHARHTEALPTPVLEVEMLHQASSHTHAVSETPVTDQPTPQQRASRTGHGGVDDSQCGQVPTPAAILSSTGTASRITTPAETTPRQQAMLTTTVTPIPTKLSTTTGTGPTLVPEAPALSAAAPRLRAMAMSVNPLDALPTVDLMPATTTGSTMPDLQLPTKGNTDCARFVGTEWRFYGSAMASVDFSDRTIAANNPDYLLYSDLRRETELPQPGNSLGLRLSAISAVGLTVHAGLTYSQFNERFYFFAGEEQQTVITVHTDGTGAVIGMDTSIISRPIILSSNNHYRTLQIPALVGYETRYGKLAFIFNAGAEFNLSFRQSGSILSPTSSSKLNFGEGQIDSPFRSKLGVTWYGSMGIHYPISRDLSILVEPYARIYSDPFTRDDFATRQSYMTTGIWLGLRKKL